MTNRKTREPAHAQATCRAKGYPGDLTDAQWQLIGPVPAAGGARPLLGNLHRACPRIRLAWADAVYNGRLTAWAAALKMRIQIIARRNPHAFEVLPRRWVVERTFAWISKNRRTVRDYERLPASHEAMLLWAMTALTARRLAEPAHLSDTH